MATMLNVYDRQTRKKTAVLQNAFNIVETHELNQIYLLTFSLPSTDEKNKFCLPRHFVRWGDNGELYRIKSPKTSDSNVGIITYECEHVITTLCDSIMFGSFQYGGTGVKTRATITWLLSQQKQQDWVLDVCDFDRKFEYLWEQENILNALYSIPKEFASPYMWTFDTTVYPWKISLRAIDTAAKPEFYLRARSNILSSGTSADYANICTRIYPLGSGEGVNQLNIKDVNNGVPYLQSPSAIVAQYGIVEKVLVDRRFENAESLKAYAQSILDVYQTPTMSRTFDVTDLYPLTNYDWNKAEVGKICKMTQDGSIAYITKTQWQRDRAGDLHIDLSTKATDIASSVADLADRVRIESVYAQGATQLYQHSKDANATPGKGMIMSLYFPQEMRQINKVLMRLKLNKFRSYSQTTDAGGASKRTSSEGGSSRQTSSSGGASTQTSSAGGESTQTSSSGGASGTTSTGFSTISGNVTSGPSSITTTLSGGFGSDIVTSKTALEGNTAYTTLVTGGASGNTGETELKTGNANISFSGNTGYNTIDISDHFTTDGCDSNGNQKYYVDYPGGYDWKMAYDWRDIPVIQTNGGLGSTIGNHYHTVRTDSQLSHRHQYYHFHKLNLYGVGSHAHSFSLYGVGSHSHGIGKHYHSIGNHTHSISQHRHFWTHDGHSHTIDKSKFAHTHGMDHTHTISLSGVGSHSHTFSVGSHTHTVSIPNHTHTVNTPAHTHTINIPNHTHTLDIPAHTHKIAAGIFESGNPSAFDIFVNGTKRASVSATSFDGDIVQWLLNDKNQVPRNQWIDVTIVPNDLAYVICSVFIQGFVQSRGGGNY